MKDENRNPYPASKSLKVAAKLLAIRKKLKLSGKFIALSMGVSGSYVCDLEKGRRGFNPDLESRYRKALQ